MTTWRPEWLRDDPRHWRAGTLDREALAAQARALAASPGFAAQAQRFAACWLQVQAAHPELRAVFRNTQRYLLLVASLVLHHRRDPADAASGVTPGALLRFFEHTAGPVLKTSPGQVKAMLAHARLHGLLQPASQHAPKADARVQRLEPSALLQRILGSWVRGFVLAMDGLQADPVLALPPRADAVLTTPAVVAEMFSYRMAAVGQDRYVLFEGLSGLRWVLRHDHGYRVMLNLVLAARPRDGRAASEPVPVPLTHTALAAAAGVSRSHLRNVLADAAADGWMHGAGGSVPGTGLALRPEAWALACEWIAREFVWMHGLLLAAHARTGGSPALQIGRAGAGTGPAALQALRP